MRVCIIGDAYSDDDSAGILVDADTLVGAHYSVQVVVLL